MPTIYSHIDDDQLLALLRKDDNNAFTEIYNRYWERLLYVAGIKYRDLAVAEEMVQDVFLDIWNRRRELNIRGTLEAYLAVSIKYKVINAQAKGKRALHYQNYLLGHTTESDNSTEEWLKFQELQQRLSKLISRLPEKCRITYQLSRDYGMSQKEIAGHLKVSEKAVEANLSRAIKSLRKSIAGFFFTFF